MLGTDILGTSNIAASDLKRALQSLACAKHKILLKEPKSREIGNDDMFSFNDDFQSKLFKIKIGLVAATRDSEPQQQETREKVEEDRKPQIDAAIVRVMKARRTEEHNNLVSEVTKQLTPRFLAQPAMIKKRIESLIERDFLERRDGDRRMYNYLA